MKNWTFDDDFAMLDTIVDVINNFVCMCCVYIHN